MRRPLPWPARIPAIRETMTRLLNQELQGMQQLEVAAARGGELGVQASNARRATEHDIAALVDGLRLLEFIEAGGS
jgi:hypothetical protein